jgi:hypothetical protein
VVFSEKEMGKGRLHRNTHFGGKERNNGVVVHRII